jgi:hypothetical protein
MAIVDEADEARQVGTRDAVSGWGPEWAGHLSNY